MAKTVAYFYDPDVGNFHYGAGRGWAAGPQENGRGGGGAGRGLGAGVRCNPALARRGGLGTVPSPRPGAERAR